MLAQRRAFDEPPSDGSGHFVPPLQLQTWLPPCRVLVVDDDAFSRKCLSALLQRELYDVALASSGEEALRFMSTTPCDLVLTDWQMPNMDGLALCRKLRETYQPNDVYVLLLTVRRAEQDRRAALAAGADDFIVKGAPIPDVLERLNVGRTARSRRSSAPAGPELLTSLTDALTGARNLRFFTEALPRELELAQGSRRALAVLSCCIDSFDQALVSYGPEVANQALRAFVSAANNCLRSSEGWLARVGENQFMIALRETRLKGAERVAKMVRKAFSSTSVRTRVGPICFTSTITVKAYEPKHGLSSLPPMAALLRAADAVSTGAAADPYHSLREVSGDLH